MHYRAVLFVEKLQGEGFSISDRHKMAEQFVIFAQAECARAVVTVKNRIIEQVKLANYKVV